MNDEATVVRLEGRVEERELQLPFREYLGAFFGRAGYAASTVVEVELADGRQGSGEATLLPSWSGESTRSALTLLTDVLHPAVADLPASLAIEEARRVLAANGFLLWALEAAILDALGNELTAEHVPIRGLIGPFDSETSATLAESQFADGFQRLKVKLTGTFSDDARRLKAVREAAQTATLITDANESIAYDDLDRYARLFHAIGVVGVEQPCSRVDVLTNGLPAADGWAWIADESIWGVEDAMALRSGPWQAWTVHPGKSRGEGHFRTLVEIASEHGIVVLLGSNLHFGPGVAGLHRLAAALPLSADSALLGHDIPAPIVYAEWTYPGIELHNGVLRKSTSASVGPGGA